jgi:Tfp pilus assembly protein PilO
MQVGSLSANRNLLIGLAIFLELAAAIAYFMYYYNPTQVKLKELNSIVEKKSREVREIEMTKRLLSEKRKEIERLRADIARLERYFPEEVFIPRVLVLLENLAQATHLKIDSITPGVIGAAKPGTAAAPATTAAARPAATPAVAPAGTPAGATAASAPATSGNPNAVKFDSTREYKTINVDFNVIGTFQNVNNFMNELTTFPKLVVVDTLTLTPRETNRTGRNSQQNKDVEVGSSVELTTKMPLTFYIQQAKQPVF